MVQQKIFKPSTTQEITNDTILLQFTYLTFFFFVSKIPHDSKMFLTKLLTI